MVRRVCRGLWPLGPSAVRDTIKMLGLVDLTANPEGQPSHFPHETDTAPSGIDVCYGEPTTIIWAEARYGPLRMVLGCGLSPLVRRSGGGIHVADDDCGGEHGHLAVCLSQGLEEGFRGVAKGDVDVDDVELPSVPDDLIDA